MTEIELWNGSTKALINPIGAWLTNLSDDEGDILFPKRTLTSDDGSKKQRGGCHVCLPNFGPGGDSGQPQHGYGRIELWRVSKTSQNTVLLELTNGRDGYEDMSSTLYYELSEQEIKITLSCTNNGTGELRLSPGFHPYFMTARDEQDFMLNGRPSSRDAVKDTLFIDEDSSSTRLSLNNRSVTVHSNELRVQAVWTDNLGDYVCAEPTQAGYAFENSIDNNQIVKPGQSKEFTVTIAW